MDPQAIATELQNLQTRIDEKIDAQAKVAERGEEVAKSVRADLDKMTQDFAALKAESEQQITDLQQAAATHAQNKQGQKSVGTQFVESDSLKAMADGRSEKAVVNFQNNTITGETGSPATPGDTLVTPDYRPGIVPGAFRQLRLRDVILGGNTQSNNIKFTRELAFTNAAAGVKEGAAKPESSLTFELVSRDVCTIAHWIKASEQVLEDAPLLASYIDGRLAYGVDLKIETQIISGNGTYPQLSGLATTGNHTDLTVVTADNNFDAANRAKEQVETADYTADVFLVNPADWGKLERTKTGITNDDTYLGGTGGAISYINNGMQPMLWGLPVVKSNSVPAGTFFCMSRQAAMYVERMGAVVEMFRQDDTNVQSNLVTIRGEARGALLTFQPSAVVYGSWPV